MTCTIRFQVLAILAGGPIGALSAAIALALQPGI